MWRLTLLLMGIVSSLQAQTPSNDLGPAFRLACWRGDQESVALFLSQGAPLEGKDNRGRTPLILACRGFPKIVELLLAHGAKIDATANDGDTAMNHACETGDLASAQMLRAKGADVNHVNSWGHTPLIQAAREGRDEVVAWLIAQKVDVNYHLTNDPALFYAVGHGHLSTVELLLAAHARTDIAPVPNPGEKNPSTILSLAAMSNQLEMLQLILDTGAHINERDNLGYTALLEASLNANPEMVTCLLDHGADLNLGNYAGLTPLMAVAENKSISLLHLFVQRGARVQDRDCDGRTALILCAMIGADDQVRELLADKADVNVADKLGETALTYAGDRGDTRMVHVLKLAGATRDDLHIIPKATPSIPLSPARRWALAVGALYAQVNADSHEMIDTPGKRFGAKRLLDRQWDVRDRESLLARLKDLEQGSTFTSVVFSQVRESGLEHGIEAKLERAFQFLFLDLWWRSKTDVAWNHCRAANLVRLGVEAGFLKETEAWQILIPIARHAQSAFSSWKEMSENFLDFREIGADERSGDFRAAAGLLLNPNDPNSPWNALPWKTDLSAQ